MTVIIPTLKGNIGVPFLSLGTIGIEYVFVVKGLDCGRFDLAAEGADVRVGDGLVMVGKDGMGDDGMFMAG
jgi:hypothetical protein